jgi:hypothetical protein
MIYVYRSSDGRARCIRFDEPEPIVHPPLELVRSFTDEERERALAFFLELGGQTDATGTRP